MKISRLEYFSSGALAGQPMNEADPHPTPHKTRLNIYLRKSTQNIIEANDGIGDPKYDFLCGNLMGSYLEARPPYLEFDDRTPDKYLFVSSRGPTTHRWISIPSLLAPWPRQC